MPARTKGTKKTAKKTTKTRKTRGESQNGVTRPKSGTSTGRVWEIADRISNKTERGERSPSRGLSRTSAVRA